LVLEGGIPVPSMMEFVLAKAAANAKAIHSLASGEASPVAVAATPAVSAKEEKEEKKEEGDTAAGLGALFG
jgi:large subunit ribosomal protein L10